MDIKYLETESIKTSENNSEYDQLLSFLTNVKSFMQVHSTADDIVSLQDNFRSLNLQGSISEKNIPTMVLWKCFDQVGMLNKVKKYVKLLMELLILKIEEYRTKYQTLMDWYKRFIELKDCIFVFCAKKDYTAELIPVIKSSVDIILKKIRKMDMKTYPQEVFAYHFYEFIVTEFFQCRPLMTSVMEEIKKNTEQVIEYQICMDLKYLSEENVNASECLNRYFNIVDTMDKQMIRCLDMEKLNDFKLLLRKLVKMEVLPKNFSIRVVKLLDVLRCD